MASPIPTDIHPDGTNPEPPVTITEQPVEQQQVALDLEMQDGEETAASAALVVRTNVADKLPPSLQWTEKSSGYVIDPQYGLEKVHKNYRGSDRRGFLPNIELVEKYWRTEIPMDPSSKDGSRQPKTVAKTLQPGRLRKLLDGPRQAVVQIDFPSSDSHFGCLRVAKDKQDQYPIANAQVSVKFRLDTQYPALELSISEDDGEPKRTVTCLIYADAIEEGLDADGRPKGVRSCSSKLIPAEYWSKYGDITAFSNNVQVAMEEGTLWVTALSIDSRRLSDITSPEQDQPNPSANNRFAPPDDDTTPAQSAPSVDDLPVPSQSKIKFHGISPQDVHTLRQRMEAAINKQYACATSDHPVSEDGEISDTVWPAESATGIQEFNHEKELNQLVEGLSLQDQLIGQLAMGKFTMHIFNRVVIEEQIGQAYQSLMDYWASLMKASIQLGHFWFYRQQRMAGTPLLSPQFNLQYLEIPRWLVQEFEIGYDKDDNPVDFTAHKVCPFRLPKILGPNDCAFLTLLATQREMEHQLKETGSLLGGGKVKCTIEFTENPNKIHQYLAEIYLEKGNSEVVLPSIDSRVTIHIGSESLMGIVVDDIRRQGSELTVFCEGNASLEPGEQRTSAFISVREDITTSARQINALVNAAKTPQESGVDIAALLHVREPTVTQPDYIKAEFGKSEEAQKRYSDIIMSRQPPFTKDQMEAAKKAVTSDDGTVLIVGPPGSGKTDLGQYIVEGLAQCNVSAFVTADRHKAVDVSYNKFKSITKLDSWRYVRWDGEATLNQQVNPFNVPLKKPSDAVERDMVAYQALENDMWDMMSISGSNLELDKDGYHAKLQQWVEHVAQQPGHPSNQVARIYLSKLKELKTPNLLKRIRKQLANEVRYMRTLTLAKQYLGNEVRVVFSTNSSTCFDTLLRFFRPQAMLGEEAGLSSLPSLAVPLAAFMRSIKLVILTGDHKQLRPIVHSRNRNEAESIIKHSLFEILIEDEGKDHILLRETFRMHGDHGGWISSHYYDNKLSFCRQPDARLDRTMAKLMCMAIGFHAWNKRRRIAVGISTQVDEGVHVISEIYPGTSSWCNEEEAKAIILFVVRALRFQPDEALSQGESAQRSINASDILILSPYRGQVLLIKKLLRESELEAAQVRRIQVRTTSQSLGAEADIVLVSLVRNNPENPLDLGFIVDQNQLNVELSRAKHYLLIFGNFQGWMKEYHKKGSKLAFNTKNSRYYGLMSLLTSLNVKGDFITGAHFTMAMKQQQLRGPRFAALIKSATGHCATPTRASFEGN
ncbi:P-loop containing nucleoside triphosphate hydrolase protein [Macrophomina phaseolina]|uniref:P-loop containing nucleoside triphosphate hydrolase protein n=1 Tax=Macrophomina phaseolina TaxID=35725 RepID=A0ABQ8FT36_9PEZI|nr:P-loop containing nucleoside triphosphate hydrolase protein [Macrophomina phaseolina]